MRLGSLFTGYGGLDLGVHAALEDVETVWVADIEPGPRKILAHRFPGVPNLGDVTQVDWHAVPDVDIIAGGSPCQDLSVAGQRAGMNPGTRSGLWESMWHATKTKQPKLVVWENVGGAYSAEAFCDMEQGAGCVGDGPIQPALRALGRVLGDLAEIGYDAAWASLRASDIGAPHSRERVFVVAYPSGSRRDWHQQSRRPLEEQPEPHSSRQLLSDRFGDYAPAISRWEQVLNRTAPDPTELGPNTKPRLNPAFVEWMIGLPKGWVTQVPDLSRAQQLRALGNGVVPQQATQAITQLLNRNNK